MLTTDETKPIVLPFAAVKSAIQIANGRNYTIYIEVITTPLVNPPTFLKRVVLDVKGDSHRYQFRFGNWGRILGRWSFLGKASTIGA